MSLTLPPCGVEIFSNCTSLPLAGLELSSRDPSIACVGGIICESPDGHLVTVPHPLGYVVGEQLVRLINWIGESLSQFTPSKLSERFNSLQSTLSPYPVALLLQNIAGCRQGLSSKALLVMNMMQLTSPAAGQAPESEQGDAIVDRETEEEVEFIFPQGCDHKGADPLSQASALSQTPSQTSLLSQTPSQTSLLSQTPSQTSPLSQTLSQTSSLSETPSQTAPLSETPSQTAPLSQTPSQTSPLSQTSLDDALAIDLEGQKLYKMKKHAEAIVKFRQAIKAFISMNKNDKTFAACLTNLGLSYLHQGNYEKATKILKWSLSVKLELYGEYHEVIAENLNNLGTCYHGKGELKDAFALFQGATRVKRKILKGNDPSLAISLMNEGKILCALGEPDRAKTRLEEAGRIYLHNGNTQAAKGAKKALEDCKAHPKNKNQRLDKSKG